MTSFIKPLRPLLIMESQEEYDSMVVAMIAYTKSDGIMQELEARDRMVSAREKRRRKTFNTFSKVQASAANRRRNFVRVTSDLCV